MIRHYQRLLILHGSLVLLLGLFAGFLLVFKLLGQVALWPLPGFDLTLPGSPRAWNTAHIGPIFNGIMAYGVAFVIALVPLSDFRQKFVTYGIVFSIWGNVAFYVGSIFGNARALTGGGETPYGTANIFDLLGYVPAAIAAAVTIIAISFLALGAKQALYDTKEAGAAPSLTPSMSYGGQKQQTPAARPQAE
ncbi:MAG: hypothetical protein AAGB03_02220 [Pseudomonadota bacterium]